MEELEQYRNYIQELLTDRAARKWDDDFQVQTIFDPVRDRYQLVFVGWNEAERIYGVVLHLDIIDGKIWVQQDGTEVGIANQLVELGVPRSRIVLGYDPPFVRGDTEECRGVINCDRDLDFHIFQNPRH
ncbi:MAG: XisI protein [Cyanobacteriota bacterium]|nr:XisI protein [Cyanobacteriota bacterium]